MMLGNDVGVRTTMLTRRAFAACALCAAGGFLASGAEAEAPPACDEFS